METKPNQITPNQTKIADWSLVVQSTYAIQYKVTELQITKTQ